MASECDDAWVNWLDALDFNQALVNVQRDVLGDWYRDPWDWRELSWLVPRHVSDYALPRLNSAGVKRSARLDVAKENFAIRPAVVLDPLDRLVYQALVDSLSVRLIGSLPPWSYGWRLPRKTPKRGVYSGNDEEWESFRSHLTRLAIYDRAALATDVVSFFSSIPEDALTEQIIALGANEPAQRLAEMVSAWYLTTGRGLPQRSAASAALAHMYLGPLDDILLRFNTIPPGGRSLIPEGRALRWMDDIWLFGRSMSSLREAQVAIQAGMRELGLEMNFGKTQVIYGEEMVNAVFKIEHSAVDAALNADDPDVAPLNELIDEVLEAPELAERTSIRFMATRMRETEYYDRIDDLAGVVERMPHAADHLARLFRASGQWIAMQDWYAGYARRWRDRLPWTVGQLGTMFPSGSPVSAVVADLFSEVVETANAPLPLLSVASQRLSAWRPADARVLLREAANKESHPIARRTLALSAVHAGEVRNVIRQMLQQDEENALVLAMLEDTKFSARAVPVSADFAG